MKTTHYRSIAALSFAAAVAALATNASARDTSAHVVRRDTPSTQRSAPAAANASTTSAAPDRVRVASDEEASRTLEHLSREKLAGPDGKDLADIKDFVVDARTGRVAYAVVSTGGFIGIGDRLHLVPLALLLPTGGARFKAPFTAADLERAPVIAEEAFEENRIDVTPDDQRRIAEAFHNPAAAPEHTVDSDAATLIRASSIKGREVKANGETFGTLKGLVLAPGATHASALLSPESSVASGDEPFLVPVDRLRLGSGKDSAVSTALRRSDFENAVRADASAQATQEDETRPSEARLRPKGTSDASATGRTSAQQTPRSSPGLVSAAHAIRQALDEDNDFSHLDVRVLPEADHVLLSGTVPDEETKADLEHSAERAAPGANLDFAIKVTK